tara:strand:+ start:1468 stop:1701 length:234 start_codon:yes stop_codon:yes gene_type:complete
VKNEVVLAFILVVFIDGSPHEIGGTAAFRDIHRCTFFAKEIERSGNERWTSSRVYHQRKTDSWCEPRFVPKETQFWD